MRERTKASPADGKPIERPDFMATLHLLPPYLPEDVQQAYRTLVRKVHPDVGGSIEEFLKIQRAYEQAQTYLEFRSSRREWIAARVDRYQRTEQVLERLRELGADATVEAPDWLERSFGEFAQFMETIEGIRLHNSPHGNELIELLLMERPVFDGLRTLSLTGSKVSDAFARRLRVLGSLKHLDLRRTAVSNEVATLAEELQDLETFRLDGTRVSRMRRWLIDRGLRRRRRFDPR